MAVLAILAVTFTLHLPKTDHSNLLAKLKRVDFAGALVLITTIFFLLFGLERGGNTSWSDPLTQLSFGLSAVTFILFGIIESRLASEPFAPKHIIFNRSLIPSFAANFFGTTAWVATIFYISLYLQAVHGETASGAGLWLVLSVLGGLIGVMAGGLIIQATGKYYVLSVTAFGMLFFASVFTLMMTGLVVDWVIGLGAGKFSFKMLKIPFLLC